MVRVWGLMAGDFKGKEFKRFQDVVVLDFDFLGFGTLGS